nr:choice-of-anchor I family protein [Shouchella patagoniensis]
MKKSYIASLALATILTTSTLPAHASDGSPPPKQESPSSLTLHDEATTGNLPITLSGRYHSGAEFGSGGAEIVAYDERSNQIFSINGDAQSIDILADDALKDHTIFNEIPLKKQLYVKDLDPNLSSVGDLTSIAVHPTEDIIAVATVADPKTDPGHVIFMKNDGSHLSTVEVGALPDMITFTPDGEKLLVANEGEPSDDYHINPEGSVSIIDISKGAEQAATIETATFSDDIVEENVRKVHPDSSYAEDLEPEFIAVTSDSSLAYVVLQESNAIAILDLNENKFKSVKSLGYKDHSETGRGMDVSDKDGKINIQQWPVLGIHQPDAIALYETNGKTYIVTPNEGDA